MNENFHFCIVIVFWFIELVNFVIRPNLSWRDQQLLIIWVERASWAMFEQVLGPLYLKERLFNFCSLNWCCLCFDYMYAWFFLLVIVVYYNHNCLHVKLWLVLILLLKCLSIMHMRNTGIWATVEYLSWQRDLLHTKIFSFFDICCTQWTCLVSWRPIMSTNIPS